MVSIRFFCFLRFRNCKRLREFEEYKSQGKAVEVTVNNKKENSQDFWTAFTVFEHEIISVLLLDFLWIFYASNRIVMKVSA